jgi:hypothetical protein
MARGVNHPELASTFRLGVADRTLGLRLRDVPAYNTWAFSANQGTNTSTAA